MMEKIDFRLLHFTVCCTHTHTVHNGYDSISDFMNITFCSILVYSRFFFSSRVDRSTSTLHGFIINIVTLFLDRSKQPIEILLHLFDSLDTNQTEMYAQFKQREHIINLKTCWRYSNLDDFISFFRLLVSPILVVFNLPATCFK